MGAIDASAGWFRNIYRGTDFQAILLGLVSFTQPGIWTAIMSLGGGGQAEPCGVNASDAITYGVIFWSGYAINKKIQKKRQEKKAPATEAEEEAAVGNSDRTNSNMDAEKMTGGNRVSYVSPMPGPNKGPASAPLDPTLQEHPNNPRLCDPECPGYGKDFCLAHQGKRPSRPTSPGLLAV